MYAITQPNVDSLVMYAYYCPYCGVAPMGVSNICDDCTKSHPQLATLPLIGFSNITKKHLYAGYATVVSKEYAEEATPWIQKFKSLENLNFTGVASTQEFPKHNPTAPFLTITVTKFDKRTRTTNKADELDALLFNS